MPNTVKPCILRDIILLRTYGNTYVRSWVPAANAPWMHCSLRLIVQTLVFSRSYLHRQEELLGREMAGNFDRKLQLPRIHFRVLLHAANMRHGTNGLTSLPKEGVLRIFFALKNPMASAGFEPANL